MAHLDGTPPYLLDLSSLLDRAIFDQGIAKLSNDPYSREGQCLLRDVCLEGRIESLSSVALKLRGVGDKTDKRRQDLLSDIVARLHVNRLSALAHVIPLSPNVPASRPARLCRY